METELFRKHLQDNRSMYKAWGDYVVHTIKSELEASTDGSREGILKIPAAPRVKDVDSAINKIYRKGYTDPLLQMTDLVGVRFVVLLSEQIDSICSIIESNASWTWTSSRDYRDEVTENPQIFDYQSRHYEVRPKHEIPYNNINIQTQTCCEIQVRTLLQHAYAELVHDTIYKPSRAAPPMAVRQVARSMALMETTDELFCHTMRMLTEVNKERSDFINDLVELYKEWIGDPISEPDIKSHIYVLDHFEDYVSDTSASDIRELLNRKKYISLKIRERLQEKRLFTQPLVLFAYSLASQQDPVTFRREWPLSGYSKDIETVLSDLGQAEPHT